MIPQKPSKDKQAVCARRRELKLESLNMGSARVMEPQILQERESGEAKGLWEWAGHSRHIMESNSGEHHGNVQIEMVGQSREQCSIPTPKSSSFLCLPCLQAKPHWLETSQCGRGNVDSGHQVLTRVVACGDRKLTNCPEDPGCLLASVFSPQGQA